MNGRRKQTIQGSGLLRPRASGSQAFKPGRVAASRLKYHRAPQEMIEFFLSAKQELVPMARELNQIFFRLWQLKGRIKSEVTQNDFDAIFDLFANDTIPSRQAALTFRENVVADSFYQDNLAGLIASNQDKSHFIALARKFASYHLSMAQVAEHIASNRDTSDADFFNNVVESLRFFERELEVLNTSLELEYKRDLSASGVKNLFAGLFISEEEKKQIEFEKVAKRFKEFTNKFEQIVLPLYKDQLRDLSLKPVIRQDSIRDRKSENSKTRVKKRVIEHFFTMEPKVAYKPSQIEMQAVDVQYDTTSCEKEQLKKTSEYFKQPSLQIPLSDKELNEIYYQAPEDDTSSSEQELSEAVIESKLHRLTMTPGAVIAGAVFGFTLGLILSPFTGGASLAFSVGMAAVFAAAIGGAGYVGSAKLDEALTDLREAEAVSGKSSTNSIAQRLDVKLEKVTEKAKNLVNSPNVNEDSSMTVLVAKPNGHSVRTVSRHGRSL